MLLLDACLQGWQLPAGAEAAAGQAGGARHGASGYDSANELSE